MANVNTIKTRILNKYDLLANYTSSFIPLKGEICLVEIPSSTSGSGLTPPAVGIKVGDGDTTFDQLQWVQAIAGDVSSFVKTISSQSVFATEVGKAIGYTGQQNVKNLIDSINTKFNNYSTTAQMNTELGKKVDTTTLTAYQNQVTELLAGKVGNNEFTTYQGTVTAALNKKVETSVADSAASSTNKLLAETAIKKLIKDDATDPINTKIGVLTNLTTTEQETIVGAINELDAEIGDTSTFTGADVSTAIKNLQASVGTGADGLVTKVETLEEEMDEVQGALAGYSSSSTVASAVADAKNAGTTAQNQVGTLGDLKTNVKTSAVAAINEIHDELDSSLTTIVGNDTGKSIREIAASETAKIVDGAPEAYNTLKEISDWIAAHPEDAASYAARINELNTALGGTGTIANGFTITPVSTQIDNKITALKLDDTYVNEDDFDSYKEEVAANIAAGGTALQKADITTGSANGTISVDGSNVSVKGLGSAAYTNSTAYATSAQGTKADSAVQKVTILGHEIGNGGSVTVAQAKTDLGLKSAAYAETTAFDSAGAASAVDTKLTDFQTAFNSSDLATGTGIIDTITYADSGTVTHTRRAIKPADMSTATNDVFVFYCGTASELID